VDLAHDTDLPWETARLILRRFRMSDLAAFMAYRNDPEVARYQSWDDTTEEMARAIITAHATRWFGTPGEGVQIAVERKDTGELVGDCYFELDRAEPRQGELGYSLARDHQHRGFATEAVSCLLDHVFEGFRLHRVVALADCDNGSSIALLERVGFRREGHFRQSYWDRDRWTDEYLYAMLEDEWTSAEGSAPTG
jgi:RimJ/RimL family protein N-acetyltransferase